MIRKWKGRKESGEDRQVQTMELTGTGNQIGWAARESVRNAATRQMYGRMFIDER